MGATSSASANSSLKQRVLGAIAFEQSLGLGDVLPARADELQAQGLLVDLQSGRGRLGG